MHSTVLSSLHRQDLMTTIDALAGHLGSEGLDGHWSQPPLLPHLCDWGPGAILCLVTLALPILAHPSLLSLSADGSRDP